MISEQEQPTEDTGPMSEEQEAAFQEKVNSYFDHIHELPPFSKQFQDRVHDVPTEPAEEPDDAPLI